jgi:CHAT domain
MKYLNFDITLSDFDPDLQQLSVRAKSAKADTSGKPTRVSFPDEIRIAQAAIAYRDLSKTDLKKFGRALANVLLPEEAPSGSTESIRMHFRTECTRAEQVGAVRLRLWIEDDALADVPWEFVYLDGLGFLALEPRISIVRRAVVEGKQIPDFAVAKPDEPMRMVLLMANPGQHSRFAQLDLETEAKGIQIALSMLGKEKLSHTIQAKFFPESGQTTPVTKEILVKEAVSGIHVLHFAGHGEFETRMGEAVESKEGRGYLILVDTKGEDDRVSVDSLTSLKESGLLLVVLAACEGARRDQTNPWSSVAAGFVQMGVPSVIGMQYKVIDKNAARFSEIFYRALANSDDIELALSKARRAVHDLSSDDNERDWGIPALYLRVQDEEELVLFPRQGSAIDTKTTTSNHNASNPSQVSTGKETTSTQTPISTQTGTSTMKYEVKVTPTFLRNYLVKHFSLEEIKLFPEEMNDLAPTVGKKLVEKLDADNINGSTKMAYAQGLVQFLERRTLLELLVALLSSKQAFVDDPFDIGSSATRSANNAKPLTQQAALLDEWSDADLDVLLSKVLVPGQLTQLINNQFTSVNDFLSINPSPAQMRSGLIQFCRAQNKITELLYHVKGLNSGGYDQAAQSLGHA